jgi:hypothetical protein
VGVVVDVGVGVGVDVVVAAIVAVAEIAVVVVVAGLLLLLLVLLVLLVLLLVLAVGGVPAAVGEVAYVGVARASSLSVSSVICCFNREASIKSSTCTADAFAMLSSAILAAMVVRVLDAVASSSREAAATLAPAAFCKHVAALSPVSPPPVTYDAVLLAWHSANSRAWPFVASAAISTIPTSAKTPATNQAMHVTLRRHTLENTRGPAAVVEDATAMGARSSARTSRSRSSGFVTVNTAMAATVLLRPVSLNT